MPSRGFSLIEVLVATGITVGVGAIVFQLFQQNERIFRDQNTLMEMQQTARMALFQISDDVRIAGQGVPLTLSEVVLPGSNAQRLNIRAGYSATESLVTSTLPFSATTGSSITLKVESTTGFSAGKQIYVWNGDGWLRGSIESVSGSAKTVRLTPSGGSASPLVFTSPPVIGLDEGIALYRDASTKTLRRTTSSNTSNTASPPWAPANEAAANVTSLTLLYFDAIGNSVSPDTPENRVRITSIEARISVRASTAIAGNASPTFSLSGRFFPRNIALR